MDFRELIYQEIDFIGQLFVEYEQLASYEDILTTPDNRRSLASLFYDFTDRVEQVRESVPAGQLSPLFNHSSFTPFLRFYSEYKTSYPENVKSTDLDKLFRQFPIAAETAAAHLRRLAGKEAE